MGMIPNQKPNLNQYTDRELLELAELLSARLERLSADSAWARRASGLRGALLETIDAYKTEDEPVRQIPAYGLKFLIERAFYILERAAREIIR